jgi:16S rRNA (guanine966-N2)-methyltransferase
MPDAGRVIAGSARGLRLLAPGEGTRPLADRVKQTLFAVLEAGSLGPWPVAFLDLFAGSGAGGIEALSRGAPSATFVELDRDAARVIATNLERTRLGAHATVLRADVLRFLGGPPEGTGAPFGAVLLDPPYEGATLVPALQRLAEPGAGWLARKAVVVAKHFWREVPPSSIGRLGQVRQRRFGETTLTFYALEELPA